MTKLSPPDAQSILRKLAMVAVSGVQEHYRYRIANADIQPGGNFGIKRNEWRTLIVWCPPCSFNNLPPSGASRP